MKERAALLIRDIRAASEVRRTDSLSDAKPNHEAAMPGKARKSAGTSLMNCEPAVALRATNRPAIPIKAVAAAEVTTALASVPGGVSPNLTRRSIPRSFELA